VEGPVRTEYTKEEMQRMIDQMEATSSAFYRDAVRIGNHPFIEFAGLMNKYIDLCRQSMDAGIQFPFANKHSALPLMAVDHDIMYLAEKFDCIFGPTLEVPYLRGVFKQAMGWEQRLNVPSND
jgi:hypothetical protein